MKTYDLLVIGFGKAGKTLAAKMSSLGKKVALVEESSSMYGGTCINIGCIPTKTLIPCSLISFNIWAGDGWKRGSYASIKSEK